MRRQDSERAKEFGERIQERLSASSLGPKEMFQLLKSFKSTAQSKMKSVAKDTEVLHTNPSGNDSEDEAATVLDEDSQEEQDIKRDLLDLLNTLADIHERIKKYVSLLRDGLSTDSLNVVVSIFIWRRPAASKKYAVVSKLRIPLRCAIDFRQDVNLCVLLHPDHPRALPGKTDIWQLWDIVLACYSCVRCPVTSCSSQVCAQYMFASNPFLISGEIDCLVR